MEETLHHLKQLLAEVDDLARAAAVLSWDQQTYMPPAGVHARAAQMATLEKLAHARFVSDEIGQLLEDLRPWAEELDADSDTACLIRVTARECAKARKVPEELVAALAQKTALAHNIWVEARQAKDFAKFQPVLEELVELTRQKAEHLGYTDHIYDPLLDAYEPEMKTAEVAAIFADLKTRLIPLIQEITAHPDAVQDTLFQGTFDVETQWEFGVAVLRQMGYDFERGRQDKAAHPFTTSFTPDDVRITTRLDPKHVTSALFSSVHEGGHALYEQGISRSLLRTPLGDGASMAVHESQSRLWENVIGRSRACWTYFLPQLQNRYPEQLQEATLDQVYQAVNVVRPDYIRVEADELTYNLHIFLRFELETALLAGEIAVSDLPELWNQKMQRYLGLTPPDAALGVLQDVHWSAALFGYFPTYALGNVLSVQIYDCVLRDIPDLTEQIARGDFRALLDWLRTHIHAHGAKFAPQALVRRVTGEAINPQPYLNYLTRKYRDLYGLP
jgi:carboxypeptidase Taq